MINAYAPKNLLHSRSLLPVYTEGSNKRLLESARCNLIFRVISVIMKKIKVEIDDAENRMNHPAWMIQIVQIPRAKRL